MKLTIPANYVHTRATQFFDKSNVPAALLSHHNTKAGVYGRLSVMRGAVKYFGFADAEATTPDLELVIEAGCFGISPPQKWHRIELLTDDTYFNIDFFAEPEVQLSGKGFGQVVNTHKD
ncbi:DUF1971 domain-containing protein [Buttiauxella noackiae]|jgi:tellurite resistance-related uncharacterized protein|uniref:Putative cytoplasmic protein n=1 Tax=Buttiauxella noackiae ATCC 51607 TaxID=1354255 RepID=A0A1B7HXN6_9ENTR|nr:DUF1971 domain-containing protein [Buttiauxella noackiae]MCA1923617.1 DUF1971 domain-containing protein [Buttiauxella noackiae]OAT20424.1 putative cytoplasmic protein [Buttiauxella noackiae ATCC 51607]